MKFPPLNIEDLKLGSLGDRPSKVSRRDFAQPWQPGGSLSRFLEGLPNILAAEDLIRVADAWAEAVANQRPVILAMGGHPVKVGLSPVIIDLMKRGCLSLLAVNGSVMVHDVETALVGATSEDVGARLHSGEFGMTLEANELINEAAAEAASQNLGLGKALGRALKRAAPPYAEDSLFASAAGLDLPVTVHVAMGTDVYHLHPAVDGAALGRASLDDFQTFCRAVGVLAGGLFINLGSAVIMPEVFLKAVTLVRNLGRSLENLTTVNMDFIRHYRPTVNVVQRPTAEGGQGYHLTGHHEIMFPLLAAALIERL